ncbi:MAG: FTR1 family iron permease, partial [bacterium]
AMPSWELLTPEERWNLSFYVFRLGHEGDEARGPVGVSLADLASRTDRELRAELQEQGHPAPAEGVVEARRVTAFNEPPAGLGLDRTRRLLKHAVLLSEQGRREEADRAILDAYLDGFEPLEVRLRGRDAQGTAAVETGFRDLRVAVSRGSLADVRARYVVLDERLQRVGGGTRAAVPFLAALLIYFREGIEAALLVGALLAGVQRLGRKDARRYVHLGWILAVPAGVLTWWASQRLITVTANQRELSEAVISLVAAAVLFSMSFWMISRVEARRWTGYLRRGLEQTLSRRNLLLLAGLSFLAVYREAAETVLFTQALLLDHDTARNQVWLGALAGLLAVLALALVMSRTVTRLPMGPFFAVSSALLCALAISFAGSGMYELVAAGYVHPRPVPFPEVPWMGIHPDLTALLLQLLILGVIATGAFVTLRRSTRAE